MPPSRPQWSLLLICIAAFSFAFSAQDRAIASSTIADPGAAHRLASNSAQLHRVVVSLKGIQAGDKDRIAAARQRVLDAIRPYRHEVNRSYDVVPALALVVDDDALRVLKSHPDVASVAPDGRTRPSGQGRIR